MTTLEAEIERIVERIVDRKMAALSNRKAPADYRIDGGYTTADAAARASGVAAPTIRNLESGDYKFAMKQRSTCERLARVYGCDPDELQKAAIAKWQAVQALKKSQTK